MSLISTIERNGGRVPTVARLTGLGAWLAVTYAGVAYLAFLGVFAYAAGFIHNALVPKGIDDGVSTAPGAAIAINVALLGAFAIQHTIMARPRFKRRLAEALPRLPERSTFVVAAAVLLALLYWQWRPLPEIVWDVTGAGARAALIGVSLLGFGLVVIASFQIDHFHLFGLRQMRDRLMGRPAPAPTFSATGLYRHVRHPLMLGFLIAFWATPTMTLGHLVFSAVVSLYVFVGTHIEERDLIRELGEPYRSYRRAVPAILPRPWRRKTSTTS